MKKASFDSTVEFYSVVVVFVKEWLLFLLFSTYRGGFLHGNGKRMITCRRINL